MIRRLALCLALVPGLLVGQEPASGGTGAVLRGLDKMTGKVEDLELTNGSEALLGRLSVQLGDCRFPEGNPAGDAFARMTIREAGIAEPVFDGWMIASSPALSALDHPRYDIWVLRCTTS